MITMSEEYHETEKLLRDVDFTKGSGHKDRLRTKLSEAAPVFDELQADELSKVTAAVKRNEGFDIAEKRK
ncbi:MAG: hypothetical protein K6E34_08565 [Lachnospiraceae bacterium]|nr:hypothetical protein [Lachnospiraceae bacterium]